MTEAMFLGGVVLAALVAGGVLVARLIDNVRLWWTAYRRRFRIGLVATPVLATGGVAADLLPLWVLLLTLPVLGLLFWRRVVPTAAKVTRSSDRIRRKSGVASTFDVWWRASARAMRRKAHVVRPSLADLPWKQRRQVPPTEFAVRLCRTAGQWLWASVEDVTLVFGGPRRGKSGWLADVIADAPGAVITTSTRGDLLKNTRDLRGGPVLVFNAVDLGAIPSTLTFDPLTGCADSVTANARATDLLSTGPDRGGDGEFWNAQAVRVLAAFLHAAALGGLSMQDVLRWTSDPEGCQQEIASYLRRSVSKAWVLDATQFVTTNDKTRSSITSTIMPALGWLNSPAAAAAAAPIPDYQWTVEDLLAARATVHLLGAQESQSAPLVAAFLGHLAREARRIAGLSACGRLDPPLLLALDEAALVAPDALIDWSADMGGRGVTIIAALQSRSQLRARWGRDRADTVMNNAGAVMVFGGTRSRDDLEDWSSLGGDRDEQVATVDAHGRQKSSTTRKVKVLAGSQISNLAPGRVIVFRNGIAPVVGRARMVWQRRDEGLVVARWFAFVRRLTDRIVTPAPAAPPVGDGDVVA